MSERKLIILGTASQVPGRERNQNGYFLRFDGEGLLFDPGEGTQRQMIHAGVAVSGITKIFISHFHGDHCLGLAGVIQRISLDRVPHVVEVYFPASGRKYYERLRDACSYHNEARLEARPVFQEGVIFEDNRLLIRAGRLDHDIETFGYRVQEKDSYTLVPETLRRLGISGRIAGEIKKKGLARSGDRTITIEDVGRVLKGQTFAYVMDTRVCEAALELARGADLLLIEATYLSDLEDKAGEYGHLTAAQAGTMARDSGAGLVVLAHYSQRYSSSDELVQEASRFHPKVVAAKDGDHIEFPKRRRSI